MLIRLRAVLAAALCVVPGSSALAEESPPVDPPAAAPPLLPGGNTSLATDAAGTTPAVQAGGTTNAETGACCTVPAGSPVLLEIIDTVSSARAARGDAFRIRLVEPVRLGGTVAIPAGTEGQGEVIHAQHAGSGGKPGELLLAARHLDHAGRRIMLRGMKLGGGGTNRTGTSLAASLLTGPFGLLVRGGDLEVPAGTVAQAKLLTALAVDNAIPAPPATSPSSTTSGDASGNQPQTADTPATTTTQQE